MNKEEVISFYLNYRLYIFPFVVVLSSLILIVFVIFPQTMKLITNQKAESEMINKSSLLETKAQTLETLDEKDLNQKVGYAINSLPTDKEFISDMAVLQDITARSGFSAVSIVIGNNISSDANTQSYNIKLEVLGPSTMLQNLLTNIEDSPRLVRVNSVEASVGKGAQNTATSLDVSVLFSAAPKNAGGIDTPLPTLSQKDEEILVKLARSGAISQQPQTFFSLGSRGKTNPFE